MKLLQGDCLSLLPTIKESSIDLIVTDPPYFRVKSDEWDNQWQSETEFLAWCNDVLKEMVRVLKPNGSLYWFAGPYMAAKIELLIAKHCTVLNHLVWVKSSGHHHSCRKQSLRKFFPQTERIIFAEPKASSSQFSVKANGLHRSLFTPMASYFNNLRKAAGLSLQDCIDLCGSTSVSHYFSVSQFSFPSEAHFYRLMKAFGAKPQYVKTRKHFESLKIQYNALKKQYRQLRRPFSVTKEVPFTDVWHFSPVTYYAGKHPCEKPVEMLEHIINTSSHPGHTVLDAFMGSGNTGQACLRTGRKFIGIERDTKIFNKAKQRLFKA